MSISKAPVRLPVVLRQLPPLPQVTLRALELIQNPRSRRDELARVLSLDQGMTGLFLRMVNSAYYSLPRRISSLDQAIGYLGYETVRELIFAISTSKLLARPVPSYMLDKNMLWHHSVAVAAGTDWIAKQRNFEARSEAYVAGLLHDVGKLGLDLIMEHQARWEDDGSGTNPSDTWLELEKQVTGHDHAEVGAVIVRSWNLPDRVVEAVAYHHTPRSATIDPKFTSAVHIANVAALMAGIGIGVDGLRYTYDDEAARLLDWSEADMMTIVDRMQQAVTDAEETLNIS